jgi:hypothetical protein
MTFAEIEAKHLGRCVDRVWAPGRQTLIESMAVPKAKCRVVVVRHFEKPVPKKCRSWPRLEAVYVYVPLSGEPTNMADLDLALTKFTSA